MRRTGISQILVRSEEEFLLYGSQTVTGMACRGGNPEEVRKRAITHLQLSLPPPSKPLGHV